MNNVFLLQFDTGQKMANFLVGAQNDQLGIDYVDRRNGLVNAITRDDVQRVAKRLLQAEKLFFVVVGQPVLDK